MGCYKHLGRIQPTYKRDTIITWLKAFKRCLIGAIHIMLKCMNDVISCGQQEC